MSTRGPARRLQGLGTSIFTEITRLAIEHRAANLGQGFPDFPAPDFVKQAAIDAIAADHNQYAAAPGLPSLRRAVASHFERRHGVAVDPDLEVTVTGGATEGVFDAVMALLDPGDEVVVFQPFYDLYLPAVQFAGGTVKVVTLRPPRWELDPAEVAAAFGPRTKLAILNTPHNPTGKVWTPAELDLVARACHRARRLRHLRRGLQRDHLRRRPPRPDRHPARHARPDRHRGQPRQDLQRDRLEDRLDHRRAGADRGHPRDAPVRDLLQRDPVPGGRRRRPEPRPRHRLFRPAARASTTPAACAWTPS